MISFFLCTSPLGMGTYSSASRSNSVAYASERPTLYTINFQRGEGQYFDSSSVGFDVDDVADGDVLLLDTLINTRIQFQILCPPDCLQSNNHTRNSLPISA